MGVWGEVVIGGAIAAALLMAGLCALRGLVPGAMPPKRSDYLREPPDDLPPAVVSVLLRGDPGGEGLAATIVDLARRRAMQVTRLPAAEKRRKEAVLCRTDNRSAELRRFEKAVLELIFSKSRLGSTVPLSKLSAWAADHEREAADWYDEWRQQLIGETVALGLVRAVPIEYRGMAVAAALTALMFAVAMWPSAASPILLSAGVVSVALTFRRSWPTRKGVKARRTCLRLSNYLRDFGRFHEKAPEAVAVWDEYLVFAIALGLAPQATQALSFLPTLPVASEDTVNSGSWWPHVGVLLPSMPNSPGYDENRRRVDRFIAGEVGSRTGHPADSKQL